MICMPAEVRDVVRLHELWVAKGEDGKRADFSESNLREFDFSGRDLRQAIFRRANLRNIDMSGSSLSHADFYGVDLSKSDLRNADLRVADLSEADLSGADLSRADLRGAYLRGANLRNTNLCQVDLRDTDLGDIAVIQIGPIGSRRDQLVVKRFANGTTEAMTGCFRGTLDQLSNAAIVTHMNNPRLLKEYRAAIAYCRTIWEGTK